MNTIYVVLSAAAALTFFSVALAKLVPDDYDRDALRLRRPEVALYGCDNSAA